MKEEEKNRELIKKFVTERVIEQGRESCLMIALETARILCGRDKATGKKTDKETDIIHSDEFKQNIITTQTSFAGLIHYLLLLDLIGAVFIPKDSNIARTIKHFHPEMNEREVYAIVALRNSLAHNYGLVNIPKYKKQYPNSLHMFSLDNFGGLNSMVEVSETIWNKKFTCKDDSMTTNIDIPKLVDFFEEIYQTLVEKVENEKLDVVLNKGIEELKSRFTITH